MGKFAKACDQEHYTDLELAGLIQMFEFSFELSWKTIKDLLFVEGIPVNSPRESLRQGHAFGLIDDIDTWLEALDSRNRLSHTYDEATAQEAKSLVRQRYAPLLTELLARLKHRRDQS